MRSWVLLVAVLCAACTSARTHHHSNHHHAHHAHHAHHSRDNDRQDDDDQFAGIQMSRRHKTDSSNEKEYEHSGSDEDSYEEEHNKHNKHAAHHESPMHSSTDYEEDSFAASFAREFASHASQFAQGTFQLPGQATDTGSLPDEIEDAAQVPHHHHAVDEQTLLAHGPGEESDWSGPQPPPMETSPATKAQPQAGKAQATQPDNSNDNDVFESLPASMRKQTVGDTGLIHASTEAKDLRYGDKDDDTNKQQKLNLDSLPTGGTPEASTTAVHDTSDEQQPSFWKGKSRRQTEMEMEAQRLRRTTGSDDDADGGDEDRDDEPRHGDLLSPEGQEPQPTSTGNGKLFRRHATGVDDVTQTRRVVPKGQQNTVTIKPWAQRRPPAPKGDPKANLDAQNLLSLMATAFQPASQADQGAALDKLLQAGSVEEGVQNLLALTKTGEPKDPGINGVASILKLLASSAVKANSTSANQFASMDKGNAADMLQTLVQTGLNVGSGVGSGSAGTFNPLAAMLLPVVQGWIKDHVQKSVPPPFNSITGQGFQSWKPPEDKVYFTAPPVQAPPFNPRPASPPPLFPMPQRQRTDDVEWAWMRGRDLPYQPNTKDPNYAYFDAIQPKPDKQWKEFTDHNSEPDVKLPFTPSALPDSDMMESMPRSGVVAPLSAPYFGDHGDIPEHQRNPATETFPYPGIY